MKKIFKYPIQIKKEQMIDLPFAAHPIHAGLDAEGTPCIWAEVYTSNTPDGPSKVCVVPTGGTVPGYPMIHLGTLILGGEVLHVYSK